MKAGIFITILFIILAIVVAFATQPMFGGELPGSAVFAGKSVPKIHVLTPPEHGKQNPVVIIETPNCIPEISAFIDEIDESFSVSLYTNLITKPPRCPVETFQSHMDELNISEDDISELEQIYAGAFDAQYEYEHDYEASNDDRLLEMLTVLTNDVKNELSGKTEWYDQSVDEIREMWEHSEREFVDNETLPPLERVVHKLEQIDLFLQLTFTIEHNDDAGLTMFVIHPANIASLEQRLTEAQWKKTFSKTTTTMPTTDELDVLIGLERET
jgi:hypothetical protein